MTYTTIIARVALLLALVAMPFSLRADQKPLSDVAKLEILIKNLETLKDAKFIRNGSTYDSKSASKFLMNKLDRHRNEIKTALEFIDKHAGSSSDGNPYIIRLKSGQDVKCSDYLKMELKKLDSPK